ncbi:hypothetical protein ZHAS_00005523 [Anopheles sinensis]|uniref:Uncharacterized protein n=1 Tax=Anopheles sinensis TaxID=74873 RepID=A0A084VJR6_ANOSI|nr:hypothetical protein ZHAS_00005523 [Anopheles sinensis]
MLPASHVTSLSALNRQKSNRNQVVLRRCVVSSAGDEDDGCPMAAYTLGRPVPSIGVVGGFIPNSDQWTSSCGSYLQPKAMPGARLNDPMDARNYETYDDNRVHQKPMQSIKRYRFEKAVQVEGKISTQSPR